MVPFLHNQAEYRLLLLCYRCGTSIGQFRLCRLMIVYSRSSAGGVETVTAGIAQFGDIAVSTACEQVFQLDIAVGSRSSAVAICSFRQLA